MPPKRRSQPSPSAYTIQRFLVRKEVNENAGANREEVGEGGVPGGGVPGGGVRGGGSQETPDTTQEETAGGERTFNLPDTPCVNPGTPCVNQEEKAAELHGHNISWEYDKDKKKYSCYCNKAGTIYESLQRFDTFQEIDRINTKGDPNKKKELVILISVTKAISSHFPCQQIPTENLIIKYINAKDNQTTTDSVKIENPGEIITFSMKTFGSKNINKVVMKNLELKKAVDEVCVYGYKGQTVRATLEQDGRFSDEVLQTNYILVDTTDGKLTEMSSPVDGLDGKCFKVERIGKNGTKQEEMPSRTGSSKSNQPTPNQSNQPTPNQSNQPTPNKSRELSIYQPIPKSEELLQCLRSQFKDLVKQMKERQNLTPKAIQNHLTQEFGKSTKFCHEVRAMRRFLELGDSVCQVRIDESPAGSGFLLFGKYILTNAHVVLDEAKKHLMENITVIFSYEKLTDSQSMGVEVVAHDFCLDAAGHKQDWALLEVCGDQNTQPIKAKPLLKHFGLVTESGQICIIGHPDGKVKMMDPCFTIPRSERKQKMLCVTRHYFFPELMDQNIQTYESCFYHGSSGSPVFNHNFKVVSMHTGGFPDDQKQGHVLEYSLPLSLITEQIIIQIVIKRKVHVLLAMITCGIPPVVMAGVKEMDECNSNFVWTEDEMINLTESFCEGDQELLKGFFRFFPQRDEPMDISS